MIELVVVTGPSGTGQKFPLQIGFSYVLGRGEDCQIRLPSMGVSKRHCRLSVLGPGQIEIEDLGSSNGTYVNGVLIKKFTAKTGDQIVLKDYVLQVRPKIPQNIASIPRPPATPPVFDGTGPAYPQDIPSLTSASNVSIPTQRNSTRQWLENNIYPWLDKLASKYDVRLLAATAIILWGILAVALSVLPFTEFANERIKAAHIETAKFYAQQIARLNVLPIVELRYRDLVVKLEDRPNQVKGVIGAWIVDLERSQFLAPSEQMGRAIDDPHILRSLENPDKESILVHSNNEIAYVSSPIRIRTETGNKSVAKVIVAFDIAEGRVSTASALDQTLSSLIWALIVGSALLLALYRWSDGYVAKLSAQTEALLSGNPKEALTLDTEAEWPALKELSEKISTLAGRIGSSNSPEGSNSLDGGSAWARVVTMSTQIPSATLDDRLNVLAWNKKMERLAGVNASLALGAEIGQACRDIAFETTLRELCQASQMQPWTPMTRSLEVSGTAYQTSVIFGANTYLVLFERSEG